MRQQTTETDALKKERAVLVSLVRKGASNNMDNSLQELVRLAETANVEVVDRIKQVRDTIDSRWFIGKGKVEEVKLQIEQLEVNTVIFDQELTGLQVRNLEDALDIKIIDRTQLILDIFAQRARTKEGIIQVELAQLNYLLPRLIGHRKNLSRLGGGIGTRGPGETKLETDRRHIRLRIHDLKRQLLDVDKHRKLLRGRRKKTGIFQVALVGYTNAGKSTLLKYLSNTDVYVENKLFATLDPISRMIALPAGQEIMLIDTVGFIQNLPHQLVAAFRSTLEEVCEADLIVHVVDGSSDTWAEQMQVVHQVLENLGAYDAQQITLFNKVDLCSSEQQDMLSAEGPFQKISAHSDKDIERVKEWIGSFIVDEEVIFKIPSGKGDIISMMYRIGDVVSNDLEEDEFVFHVRVNPKDYEKYQGQLKEFVTQS